MFLLILVCAVDIKLNPGLRNNNTCYNFFMCLWNLNSIVAHNASKLSLLEAYKFNWICLSEAFLDSSIPYNTERLYIKRYQLIRADNSTDSKKVRAGIFVKASELFVQFKLKIWMNV